MPIVNSHVRRNYKVLVLMLNIAEYGLIHTHCILALFQMLLLPDLKMYSSECCANPARERNQKESSAIVS